MSRSTIYSVYVNRRMAALTAVGFASGLPLMLTLDSLSAWLTKAGVDVVVTGVFALVALPYSLKFLWSPLMDRYVPPLLGRRRGWLVLTQLALMAGIVAMAWAGPEHLLFLAAAAMLVTFFSASQDIVADAYRTDVLSARELGAGAAVFVTGYRMAMICSGAGVLLLAGPLGWRGAFIAMAGLMSLGIIASLFAPEPTQTVAVPVSIRAAVREPLAAFSQGRSQWHVLALFAFVLLFRLPDSLANRMTMPFLLDAMHYAASDIGVIRQFAGLWVTIAGTLAGGVIVAKIGVVRSLWIFGILQAISNGGFLLLAWMGPNMQLVNDANVMVINYSSMHYHALAAVVVVESFCGGLVTAGFIAFLMSQCDRRYSATQYALLTSFMTLTGLVLASYTGFVVAALGYMSFFALTIIAGIPGMLLIAALPPAINRDDEIDGPQQAAA